MNPNRLLIRPIFLIGVCLFLAASSRGQQPTDCDTAFTVLFGDGSSFCANITDVVGLQPNQAVTVIAQYPLTSIQHQITAVALDGGRILGAKTQSVRDSGAVQFQFRAGSDVGAYQISLRDGSQETAVSFWVLDSQTPTNNPVVVNQ
jgi:ABC-type phosphate transport system substrate-binding protein